MSAAPVLDDGGVRPPFLPPHGAMMIELPDGGTTRRPFLGRPLLVQDEPRVAKAMARNDWAMILEPMLATLSPEERAVLAEMWTRDAASEHASIASFSRFSLQLLALGAPADLVEAAHDAALDEARHARDAYALASAYAGEAIGPGKLDVTGALEHIADVTLARLAAETFEQGCVGETLAAWDAREKFALCNDSHVRDVLSRVAEDEERHAELAWRTVVWAVRAGGDDVKAAIEKSLAQLSKTSDTSPNSLFSSVISPCARALLDA
jgi:hypothetical protein